MLNRNQVERIFLELSIRKADIGRAVQELKSRYEDSKSKLQFARGRDSEEDIEFWEDTVETYSYLLESKSKQHKEIEQLLGEVDVALKNF